MGTAKAGTSESWVTLQYDEWMCVSKGRMILTQPEETDTKPLMVTANETVLISAGTKFKLSFPDNCEYIPVCLPACSPWRCRDDTKEGEDTAENVLNIHGKKQAPVSTETCFDTHPCFSFLGSVSGSGSQQPSNFQPAVLYHMLPERAWEAAKKTGNAYYPRTFETDDCLTRATGVPSKLIDTANQQYTDVPGKWICLEFTRRTLKDHGIHVRGESIIGGIPVNIPHKVHDMTRDEKGERFLD